MPTTIGKIQDGHHTILDFILNVRSMWINVTNMNEVSFYSFYTRRIHSSNNWTSDPAVYSTQLGLQIDNRTLPMTTHPKILGLTFDPKLTYNRHIDLAATKARKTINILKVLTSTKWRKYKEPYSQHAKS